MKPYPSEALLLVTQIRDQAHWSRRTFGPGRRTRGVCDHIRKELDEVEESGGVLDEWVDVLTLAIDGCWRTGASAGEIVTALRTKLLTNMEREWPDWRTCDPEKAIEHERWLRPGQVGEPEGGSQ